MAHSVGEIPVAFDKIPDRRLRLLADAMPQLAWLASSDGSRTWFNRRWCDYTGMPTQQAVGWGWQNALDPAHVQRAVDGFRNAVFTGQPWENVFPLRSRQGDYRWFLTQAVPLGTNDDEPGQWLGTNTDITPQLEANEKLCESEARFRALVHASPTGIAVFGMDGDTVFFNPKCEELHDVGHAQARGEGWTQALHPDDRQRVIDSWRQAYRLAQPWSETYRFLHANGEIVWVNGRAAPMRVGDRQIGYVATLEDITTVKTAKREQERLFQLEQQARCRAERAASQRDETLGVVAHDLRNSVHILAILARQMLKKDAAAQADPSSNLNTMVRTVEGMTRLIRDLLDVSTIETGGLTLELDGVDVRAVLKETVASFGGVADEKCIALSCDAPDGLPTIFAERSRLDQVLANLVGNALKFTQPGGNVRLEAQPSEDCVRISVIDNGPGMPADNLDHVFDRFWQARRTRRAGSGLGLAIARGIVEAHGGHIWAESALGVGTRMMFTIPVVTACKQPEDD